MEPTADVLALAKERYAVRDYHGVVFLLSPLAQEGKGYADSFNLLGLALAMVDRAQEALEALDEAVRLNPRYVEAHLNRAVLLNQLGRLADAQEAMRHAAELGAPDESGFPAIVANKLANSHAALGHDYRAAGALDRAIEQYRRALELRPAFADIRLALGRALLEHGQHAEAAAELALVTRVRPDWLDAMLLRGLAAYLQGDLDSARQVWDEASARHPEEPRLEIYRSMLARRSGERRES